MLAGIVQHPPNPNHLYSVVQINRLHVLYPNLLLHFQIRSQSVFRKQKVQRNDTDLCIGTAALKITTTSLQITHAADGNSRR